VEIAMHCNLRPPDVSPVALRFNYETDAKFEVGQLILSCLITLRYFVILTFVPLILNMCSV